MDFSASEKLQTLVGRIDAFVDKQLIPLEPIFLIRNRSCNSGLPQSPRAGRPDLQRRRRGSQDFRRQANFKTLCVNDRS